MCFTHMGFVVGFKNGHSVVYSYVCDDFCPDEKHWHKKYGGKIDRDECLNLKGEPYYMGFSDIKPGLNVGYDGCLVK